MVELEITPVATQPQSESLPHNQVAQNPFAAGGRGLRASPLRKMMAKASPLLKRLTRVRRKSLQNRYRAANALNRSESQTFWDVYLSFDDSAAELAGSVRESLGSTHRVGPQPDSTLTTKLENVRSAYKLVVFLTPSYFDSAVCCAEFCEAVEHSIEVVPVCVEGSSWAGMPFPALSDVPETAHLEGGATVHPRDAASAVFGTHIAISHKAAYLDAFLHWVRERVGVPLHEERSLKLHEESLQSQKEASEMAPITEDEELDVADDGRRPVHPVRFDAFLSHKRTESQDTVARVHDRLSDHGYRAFLDRQVLADGMTAGLRLADGWRLLMDDLTDDCYIC